MDEQKIFHRMMTIFEDIVSSDILLLLPKPKQGHDIKLKELVVQTLYRQKNETILKAMENVDLIRLCANPRPRRCICIDPGLYTNMMKYCEFSPDRYLNILQVAFWHIYNNISHLVEFKEGIIMINSSCFFHVVVRRSKSDIKQYLMFLKNNFFHYKTATYILILSTWNSVLTNNIESFICQPAHLEHFTNLQPIFLRYIQRTKESKTNWLEKFENYLDRFLDDERDYMIWRSLVQLHLLNIFPIDALRIILNFTDRIFISSIEIDIPMESFPLIEDPFYW
eukprot:TRINITY_DN2553_c0_g1_i12.p1 TRINITY_DN2553_c0_g1~~TRINITY_DN2553_c0_g1_i12.p1  ORF type:complete len:281 (+),score=25.91 TRINITY_DN2553_c0_g1_i12:905-1747(+)